MYLGIFVALPDDTALPLLKVGWPPRAIQMVQGHQLLLAVGSGTHALCAAQQHTHLTGPHLGEQVFLLRLRLGIVDIGDLMFRHTHRQQLISNIIVDTESTLALGRGQIAEDHLRRALLCCALPNVKYRLRALGRFALWIAGQHGIDEPLV